MTTFVLDSSAVLRMLDKEAGWQRVAEVLESFADGSCCVCLSAIQWGEIAGKLRKRGGISEQNRIVRKLEELQLHIESATPALAIRAAELKVDRKISYADAFALELAMRYPDRVLITADYEFKKVVDLVKTEFLPVK
jgi:predicted nucleic acid-binding protein